MEVRIGKREIPLFFSTYEMIAIQREIGCTAAQLRDEVFGLKMDDEDPTKWTMDVATDAEKIDFVAARILREYRGDFEELAK